jgi:hypothetical protein
MALKFSNQEVAKKFNCIAEVNIRIDTPEYSGMLVDAPLNAVEAMATRNSNLVQPIKVVAASNKVEETK